jgi:hypothetical protein
MKKRVAFLGLCVAAALALSSCDFFGSFFWPTTTLSDGQEAWAALNAMYNAAFNDTVIDNGSTSTMNKWKNADDTLFWDQPNSSQPYPHTVVVRASTYLEPASGYTLSGTLTFVYSSPSVFESDTINMNFDHDSKLVKKVTGKLTGASDDTLKINNETYAVSDLGG